MLKLTDLEFSETLEQDNRVYGGFDIDFNLDIDKSLDISLDLKNTSLISDYDIEISSSLPEVTTGFTIPSECLGKEVCFVKLREDIPTGSLNTLFTLIR